MTRQRMTHSASWMERSASSITSLLEPLTTMLTVFPGLLQPVICGERHQMFTESTTLPHGVWTFNFSPWRCFSVCFLNRPSTKTRPDAYLDQLAGAVQADLLCQLCRAEHLWKEVVDVGDRLGANSLEGRGDFVLLSHNEFI